MASTYSTNLRLELIGTGEQQGTWGNTTNTNLGTLLEEAIGGYVSVTVSDVADTTLTTNNGSADQARNMVINLTGTISAARNVICPAIEKVYIVRNATTGGYAVTFKVSGQTGVSIPNGSTYLLYVNGTDAVAVTGSIASQAASNVTITGGTISGLSNLSVANATVATQVRTNLSAAGSGAVTSSGLTQATNRILGRTTASTGAVEEISVGSNLSFSAGTLDLASSLTISGDVNLTGTGALRVPVGTTAQRPSGDTGDIRYNSNTASFEGYTGSGWGSLGGGATGAGGDQVFYLNSPTVTTNYSIPSGQNAHSVGPITVNSGVTVTVPSGSRWVVL